MYDSWSEFRNLIPLMPCHDGNSWSGLLLMFVRVLLSFILLIFFYFASPVLLLVVLASAVSMAPQSLAPPLAIPVPVFAPFVVYTYIYRVYLFFHLQAGKYILEHTQRFQGESAFTWPSRTANITEGWPQKFVPLCSTGTVAAKVQMSFDACRI